MELCHVFMFVAPGAPEAERLAAVGLHESFRREHPGQGTANLCYCFDNAYLELLWVADASALAAPAVARTGLAERAAWRLGDASPFGIAVRTEGPDEPLPFDTWHYRPPYLPAGVSVSVAVDSADPLQPMVFRSPGGVRPDRWKDGRAGRRQRSAGLAEVTMVEVALGAQAKPSRALAALAAAGIVEIAPPSADGPGLRLTLSGADGAPPACLALPAFDWRR